MLAQRTGEGLDELNILAKILAEGQIYLERLYPYREAELRQDPDTDPWNMEPFSLKEYEGRMEFLSRNGKNRQNSSGKAVFLLIILEMYGNSRKNKVQYKMY